MEEDTELKRDGSTVCEPRASGLKSLGLSNIPTSMKCSGRIGGKRVIFYSIFFSFQLYLSSFFSHDMCRLQLVTSVLKILGC